MTDTPNTTQGKGAVDWTKPIEAVHEDGRTQLVSLYTHREWPDVDGDWQVQGVDKGAWSYFNADGRHKDTKCPWRIRNVPEHPTPTQYAPELVASMEAFVRRCAGGFYLMGVNEDGVSAYEVVRDAKSIVSDLPQEVDPDEEEAQQLIAGGWSPDDRDYLGVRALALSCIKLGRQLERGEAA